MSDEPRKFAEGGVIRGEPGRVRIERLGVDAEGFQLISINGSKPERLYTADDVRRIGRGEFPS
jgi:hypothetical protein